MARGRDLRDMADTEAGHRAGNLSARHVRLLARARKAGPDAFASDEAWLVAQAAKLTFGEFVTMITYWCQLAAPDDAEERARKRYENRNVKLSSGMEGTGHLQAEFEPVGFAIFTEALRRIEQEFWETDWAEARDRLGPDAKKRDLARSDAQRRYDALIEMAKRSAAVPDGARLPVPLITVHIDHPTATGRLCELSNGTVVTPGEILPLFTRCDIERAVFAGADRIVNLGRTQRFFVGGTRRAVQIIHPTCTHPTCNIPSNQCDIDHTLDWEAGGPTNHDNGQPRCPTHHPKRRQRSKATRKGTTREGDDDSTDDDHG